MGDAVRVTYVDAAEPSGLEPHARLMAEVPETRRLYPLVFVNEQLAVSGSADYYDIAYQVQRAIEASEVKA